MSSSQQLKQPEQPEQPEQPVQEEKKKSNSYEYRTVNPTVINDIPAREVVFDDKNRQIVVTESEKYLTINTQCVTWIDALDTKSRISFGTPGTQMGQFLSPCGLAFQSGTDRLLVCNVYNRRVDVLPNYYNIVWSGHKSLLESLPSRQWYVQGPNVAAMPLSSSTDDVPPQMGSFVESQVYYSIGSGFPRCGSSTEGCFRLSKNVRSLYNGNIVVSDSGKSNVQIFDPAGRYLSTFGGYGDEPDKFWAPKDMCYHQSLLIVVDSDKNSFSCWDPHHHNLHLFSKTLPMEATGVCVDLKGYLYISFGFPFNSIFIYDPRVLSDRGNIASLQRLGTLEGAGKKLGEFHNPCGMCVDDSDTLIVCDESNRRIQFFD